MHIHHIQRLSHIHFCMSPKSMSCSLFANFCVIKAKRAQKLLNEWRNTENLFYCLSKQFPLLDFCLSNVTSIYPVMSCSYFSSPCMEPPSSDAPQSLLPVWSSISDPRWLFLWSHGVSIKLLTFCLHWDILSHFEVQDVRYCSFPAKDWYLNCKSCIVGWFLIVGDNSLWWGTLLWRFHVHLLFVCLLSWVAN